MIGKVTSTADAGVISINQKKGVISEITASDTDFSERLRQTLVTASGPSVSTTLPANSTLIVSGSVTSLSVDLSDADISIDMRYRISFVSGESFIPQITSDDHTVVWPQGALTTTEGALYEISCALTSGDNITCYYKEIA